MTLLEGRVWWGDIPGCGIIHWNYSIMWGMTWIITHSNHRSCYRWKNHKQDKYDVYLLHVCVWLRCTLIHCSHDFRGWFLPLKHHCHVTDSRNYRKCRKRTGEIFQLLLIMYINILLLLSNWMQPFRSCMSGCLSNKTAQDSQTRISLGSELQLEQTCYDDLSLLLFMTESRRNFKWQKCVCVCAVSSCQILMASTPV